MNLELIESVTRPLLAFMLIGTTCWLAIAGQLDMKDFVALATIVVLFWFKDRADQKTSERVIDQIKASTNPSPSAPETKP